MSHPALALGHSVAAATIAAVLLIIWTISFFVAHIGVDTPMKWYDNAVSDYGAYGNPRPYIMVCWWTTAFIAYSLAGSYGTMFATAGWTANSTNVVVLLVLYGVTRILTSLFKKRPYRNIQETELRDDCGAEYHGFSKLETVLHAVFALVSFFAISACPWVAYAAFGEPNLAHTTFADDRLVVLAFACLTTIGMGLIFLTSCLPRLLGLFERVFYVGHIGFLWSLALLMIRAYVYTS
eukprot:gnl/Spiro4/4433_TR2201_c0_g1_i1.p1 gnl/Spiro4/4433_TR2201_c0_g1~~gnl/Spiro4/4433_TR2201_c0_g1_i1.p1  ORF type:complete len:237 (-),score=37.91 gnl/Spiro4/4433_TR2201_c0_g1_i1:66-776(-)